MNFKKLSIFFIAFMGLGLSNTYAQDKIYRNNGSIINSKILEIGIEEIKYKDYENPDGPTQIIDIDRVQKIKFENGKIQVIQQEVNKYDKELYTGQKENAIKFNFLAPLMGYSEFIFQRNLLVGQSYEASLGIIGLGKNYEIFTDYNTNQTYYRDQMGAFVSFGYRFNNVPNFVTKRQRMPHLLHGAYIKPVIYLGYYSENISGYDPNTGASKVLKNNTTFGSLQVEFGKQWIFSDRFALDAYFGIGYCIDNYVKKRDDNTYIDFSTALNYGVMRLGASPGFALSYGLRMGYCFNFPKKEK